MIKKEIIKYIEAVYCKPNGKQQIFNEEEALELLVWSGNETEISRNSHRWWDEVIYVVPIGDKFFRYIYATANRDESVQDLGWNFNWDSVFEVKQIKEIVEIIKYKKI